MFDSAALLKKNTTYHIDASILFSRSSGLGESGLHTVNESSVRFTFSPVAFRRFSNFTSVDGGQFPDIMFSI